jgi:hypothetical protein
MANNYTVAVQPITSIDYIKNEVFYGSEIDITKYVEANSISLLNREIDRDNNDIGLFSYGSISFRVDNSKGLFNQPYPYGDGQTFFLRERSRSIFKLKFFDKNNSVLTTFQGISNEQKIKQNLFNDKITFSVRSYDSVFDDNYITGGIITDNINASDAIKNICKLPAVQKVLTYSASNINVERDILINSSNFFQPLSLKEALNNLLLATNSVLYVNNAGAIIVCSRDVVNATVYTLGNKDVINIENYNDGTQRLFNQFSIGDGFIARDTASILEWGLRKKDLNDLENFITDPTNKQSLVNWLVAKYKYKKLEFEATFETNTVKNIDLLDRVVLNWTTYTKEPSGQAIYSLWGGGQWGTFKWNAKYGGLPILGSRVYKVIAISIDTDRLQTTLKLKEV